VVGSEARRPCDAAVAMAEHDAATAAGRKSAKITQGPVVPGRMAADMQSAPYGKNGCDTYYLDFGCDFQYTRRIR
jgi:hypothetical protein